MARSPALNLLFAGDGRRPTWLPNAGGAFEAAREASTPTGDDGRAADLTGDGRADIVSVSTSTGLQWVDNLGGSFGPAVQVSEQLGRGGLVVADIDGDGDGDVVAATWDGLTVYANESGVLAAPWTLAETGAAERLGVADFDGDGADEVVAGTLTYRADGAGGLERAETTLDQLCVVAQVVPTDLDADGDLDLQCAARTALLLQWNTGASALDPAETVRAELFEQIAAADLDADGLPDVAAIGSELVE